jgi:choline monooxygenase
MKSNLYNPTPDLSRATTLPAGWYTDPRYLESEREKVFWRTWQPVGHARDVAEAGQYFAAEIVGEPIVVTRSASDGKLRAFSNVCRHRASLIASGKGQGNVLKCPYHGWTYQLDGRLLGAPEFDGVNDWDRANVCLPEYRVEAWGPFVFVNVDGEAPPLAEAMGAIPAEIESLGCAIGDLRFSCRRDYLIDCNWKVYVDNYLEGYHLPAAHPGLFRELDYAQYRVDPFRWYSSQHAPLRAASGEEKRQYSGAADDRRALYFWIFPNFMLNVYPDNLSSNIILPVGHDKTLTVFEWFQFPGRGEVREDTIAFSDEIQREDIAICESVQKGLQSRGYDRGRFSVKRENGVHHFHLLMAEMLGQP